jgi:flavin reductase (DIM6/NTAB) family NADH-FMN oxidoreductase RutF
MEHQINFRTIEPKILYFGTPVALITTVDSDGNPNIGPMSSVWALDYTLMLGLGTDSKTYQNLVDQKECVVNFPQASLYSKVEGIANLTGAYPIPEDKQEKYKFDPDKFKSGGFISLKSEFVKPPRIGDCQLQFEAVLKNVFLVNGDDNEDGGVAAVEVRVVRVHADERLIVKDRHIDPAKWNPLIYNFRHYFGLGNELGKTFKAEI